MLSDSVPYVRACPLVRPLRFAVSPLGYRTTEEMAEYLGLSLTGFASFQRSRGRRLYGPKRTGKATPTVPARVYGDVELAEWIVGMCITELSTLALYQHIHASSANKTEAKASADSMNEARRLIKQ